MVKWFCDCCGEEIPEEENPARFIASAHRKSRLDFEIGWSKEEEFLKLWLCSECLEKIGSIARGILKQVPAKEDRLEENPHLTTEGFKRIIDGGEFKGKGELRIEVSHFHLSAIQPRVVVDMVHSEEGGEKLYIERGIPLEVGDSIEVRVPFTITIHGIR